MRRRAEPRRRRRGVQRACVWLLLAVPVRRPRSPVAAMTTTTAAGTVATVTATVGRLDLGVDHAAVDDPSGRSSPASSQPALGDVGPVASAAACRAPPTADATAAIADLAGARGRRSGGDHDRRRSRPSRGATAPRLPRAGDELHAGAHRRHARRARGRRHARTSTTAVHAAVPLREPRSPRPARLSRRPTRRRTSTRRSALGLVRSVPIAGARPARRHGDEDVGPGDASPRHEVRCHLGARRARARPGGRARCSRRSPSHPASGRCCDTRRSSVGRVATIVALADLVLGPDEEVLAGRVRRQGRRVVGDT